MGLKCSGIGLPGHFIVGLDGAGEYLDPFNSGTLLSAEDCRTLVQRMSGGQLEWTGPVPGPIHKGAISLFRVLNNLKKRLHAEQGIHEGSGRDPADGDHQSRPAVAVPKNRLGATPSSMSYRLAIGVLEAYLEEAGEPDDAKQIKDQITGLWASLSRLN